MPIKSYWYNDEQNILYIKFEASWSIEEYQRTVQGNAELIRSVDHPVVCISDFTASGPIPTQFLSAGRQTNAVVPDNYVETIIFGIKKHLEVLGTVFQRLFPKAARGMLIVKSEAEALEQAKKTLKELAH